ncbi:uncharacterized protein LOC143664274 [Tamandua tetradactyla]|uniref:uncharacterized protein LOC143664274 n=1 Tax=Tamandua tetradactyla TaxID=48850 RepID=UPI004053A705
MNHVIRRAVDSHTKQYWPMPCGHEGRATGRSGEGTAPWLSCSSCLRPPEERCQPDKSGNTRKAPQRPKATQTPAARRPPPSRTRRRAPHARPASVRSLASRPPGPQGGAREATGKGQPLPRSRPEPAASSAPLARNGSGASPGHGHFHFPQRYRQENESENDGEAPPPPPPCTEGSVRAARVGARRAQPLVGAPASGLRAALRMESAAIRESAAAVAGPPSASAGVRAGQPSSERKPMSYPLLKVVY